MVAEHYEIDLTWFSISERLKTWLQNTMKDVMTRFFTLRWLKNLVAEHYEGCFDMTVHFKRAQNLAAEDYKIEFYMIFHFKMAQNLVSEINKRDLFSHDFPLYGDSNHSCGALWNRFSQNFPLYGGLKLGCGALWSRFWHDSSF